jgi:regulator of telomere elongation helicase 1
VLHRYRDDLGNAIANFARVVPDGLLVFFPAYSLLTACLDRWKASTGTGACMCVRAYVRVCVRACVDKWYFADKSGEVLK